MDTYDFINGNGKMFFESIEDDDAWDDEEDDDEKRPPLIHVSFQLPIYVIEQILEDTGEGNFSASVRDLIVEALDTGDWEGRMSIDCEKTSSKRVTVCLDDETVLQLRVESARFETTVPKLIRLLLIGYFDGEM